MDIGSGRAIDVICRHTSTSDIRERVYTTSAVASYIFPVPPLVTLSQSLRAKQSVPVGTTKSRISLVRNFCSSRSCSVPSAVRDRSASRKELFVINLLADGRAIYLLGGPAPGNSLDQTQSFPFEWHARTSKL